MKKSFYVSLYEHYPIYEPAEGGYYYNGTELTGNVLDTHKSVKPHRFKRYASARRALIKAAKELNLEKFGGRDKYVDYDFIYSKYIGEGSFLVIERRLGEHQMGRVPYC